MWLCSCCGGAGVGWLIGRTSDRPRAVLIIVVLLRFLGIRWLKCLGALVFVAFGDLWGVAVFCSESILGFVCPYPLPSVSAV